MTTTLTRPAIPTEVRAAFLLWMGALAAGAIEIHSPMRSGEPT